jgi:hypothetical protein
MCCGQKRTELRNSQPQSVARSVPQTLSGNGRTQAVRTQPSAPPPPPTALTHQPAYTQGQRIPPQAATPVSTQQPSIRVRYVETSPIRVRGPVSDMSYEFSGTAPIQQVDARDAVSLLNTRFFRRA